MASQPVASRTAATPATSVQSEPVGRRWTLVLIGAIAVAFIIVYVMTHGGADDTLHLRPEDRRPRWRNRPLGASSVVQKRLVR